MKGCTVVVTRAADRARPLVDALTGAGAAVVEVPVVRFEAPADGGGALAAAVADPTRYAWVVFTSAVAVARTLEVVGVPGRLASLKVAVVGPATAAAVEAVGLAVTVVASPATAEGLVASMPDAVAPVPNVLYPRAAGARDAVAAGLRAKGYEVEDIEAYRTVAVPIDDLRPLLPRVAGAHAVVCTSPSTVEAFVALCAAADTALPPVAACIGPVTAASARAAGFTTVVVADEPTPPQLAEALRRHLVGADRPPTDRR